MSPRIRGYGPGYSDRLCAKCGTWTVHKIVVPFKEWQCHACGTTTTGYQRFTKKTPAYSRKDVSAAVEAPTALARLRSDPRVREVYQDDDYWWIWLADGWIPAKPARVFRAGRWTQDYSLILARTPAAALQRLAHIKPASSMVALNATMTPAQAAEHFVALYGNRAKARAWAVAVAASAKPDYVLVQWWQEIADLLADD